MNQALHARLLSAAHRDLDVEASRRLHDSPCHCLQHSEPPPTGTDSIKAVVFGGLDGVCTVVAVMAAAWGGRLRVATLLLLGCAQIVVGALSMCMGDFLATSAERRAVLTEMEREAWEIGNHPDGERAEMVALYVQKGQLSQEDAWLVANTLSQYPDFWMQHMVLHELSLIPVEGEFICGTDRVALTDSTVLAVSFLFCGGLPLLACGCVCTARGGCMDVLGVIESGVGCASAAFVLAVLGLARSVAENANKSRGRLTMILQGSSVALAAYAITTLLPSVAS